ncbi:MAG: hypothetical protein APR62_05510 [Smithella sp. SDB]|nr:MAG: hypothetical protein APR62_05510 [Smithella sp. SDB]
MFTPKNILVPTDFSKYSDAALKMAIDIAITHNANIYLLHAIDDQMHRAVDYRISYEDIKQIEKDSIIASKERLRKQADDVVKSKKVKIILDVKNGDPAEVILKEQKAKKMDLIVIASHGRPGIVKYLMGSVATKVAKSATCPVMLVKPK